MKKISLIYTLLFCVLLLTACNNTEPVIQMKVTISPISEHKYIKTDRSRGLINDYKKFVLDFYMEHDDSIKEK